MSSVLRVLRMAQYYPLPVLSHSPFRPFKTSAVYLSLERRSDVPPIFSSFKSVGTSKTSINIEVTKARDVAGNEGIFTTRYYLSLQGPRCSA